ncbi:hypothetical protein [Spiroplasma eriocheiris]|uniref:Transmembrane protein n=1 Tax=Spiroplasma eriocheiris TaxID=315358 RepID=A0A0H3XLJ2_9MOLU|nr:hypothetical protein [Spiroplasma eriocheiris]AHF57958.1 hypothetical protein SPE_0838 [Spiroplasma eriocheiris CCTCC M 207170]AKM54399.1 hypothetical protein SERIO_v1c08390 [Spiroplasma eriocheiris]
MILVGGTLTIAILLKNEYRNYVNYVNILIILLMGLLSLFIYFYQFWPSRNQELALTTIKKVLNKDQINNLMSILLLCLFMTIFIGGYGLYSLWAILFKFLSPVCLVGLSFLLSLVIAIIFKNGLLTIIFTIPVIIYPYLISANHSWLMIGAILSGLTIGTILNHKNAVWNYLWHHQPTFFWKIYRTNLKLLSSAIIIGLIIYFTIGNEPLAFFNNKLNFSDSFMLINLIPLLIVILMLIGHCNFAMTLFFGILMQTIVGFAKGSFNVVSDFNNVTILISQVTILFGDGHYFLLNYFNYLTNGLIWSAIYFMLIAIYLSFNSFFYNLKQIKSYQKLLQKKIQITNQPGISYYVSYFFLKCLLTWEPTILFNDKDYQIFGKEAPEHYLKRIIIEVSLLQIFINLTCNGFAYLTMSFWIYTTHQISFLDGYLLMLKTVFPLYWIIIIIWLLISFKKFSKFMLGDWFQQFRKLNVKIFTPKHLKGKWPNKKWTDHDK